MTTPERNAVRTAMRHRTSPPPPRDDPTATLAWLRDREVIKGLYDRYAYGVDSIDMALVRSVFHPDCVVVGTMEEGSLDDYLDGLAEGLAPYAATMHFKGNQYVELNGDEAFTETWVLGHHIEAADSPIDHLVLGVAVPGRPRPGGRRLEDHPSPGRQAMAHRAAAAPVHRRAALPPPPPPVSGPG